MGLIKGVVTMYGSVWCFIVCRMFVDWCSLMVLSGVVFECDVWFWLLLWGIFV